MHSVATGNCLKRNIENLKRFPLIITEMSLMSQLNIEAFLACETKANFDDFFFFCSTGNQRATHKEVSQ